MTRLFLPLLALLFLSGSLSAQPRKVLFKSGNIKVETSVDHVELGRGELARLLSHNILRDGINFGRCFESPEARRMPITYYHPLGPVGLLLEKFVWLKPSESNPYNADARLPAALVGMGCLSQSALPMDQLAQTWSEPPVAVIGMAAGTPASYARPMQYFDFYEANDEVIKLNLRSKKERFFHFIPDALERGAALRIIPGPMRQQLAKKGPQKFYQLMILEACSGDNGEKIVLDLLTMEGIAECMEHLTDDGILCVHTSHRFVDMPPVLAAIARDLKLHARRGHDSAPGNDRGRAVGRDEVGHWSSEWVMLARKAQTLDAVCHEPANYKELLQRSRTRFGREPDTGYWTTPMPVKDAWTDKGPNLLHGVLRGHPYAMKYTAAVEPLVEVVNGVAGVFGRRQVVDSWIPQALEHFLVEQQLSRRPDVRQLWP